MIQPCVICGATGTVPDYNESTWQVVRRSCPCCKGTRQIRLGVLPSRDLSITGKHHPTHGLALSSDDFAGYVQACRRAGLRPVDSERWCSWRKRARQRAKTV